MRHPLFIALLVCAIVHLNIGCARTVERHVDAPNLPPLPEAVYVSVTLRDGKTILFNQQHGRNDIDTVLGTWEIIGRDTAGSFHHIRVTEIDRAVLLETNPSNFGKSVLLLVVAAGVLAYVTVSFIGGLSDIYN